MSSYKRLSKAINQPLTLCVLTSNKVSGMVWCMGLMRMDNVFCTKTIESGGVHNDYNHINWQGPMTCMAWSISHNSDQEGNLKPVVVSPTGMGNAY